MNNNLINGQNSVATSADFKAYALEKINECNTLMANEPMTIDLAFNIYEIALYLNDFRYSHFKNEEELEFIGDFFNCALALESAVKNMVYFFNNKED